MTDKEQREIFRKNLLEVINRSGKTQKEIADAIGVSQQTFNAWCRGISLPRIGKIELLAKYFKVPKSRFLDSLIDYSFTIAHPITPEMNMLLLKYNKLNEEGRNMLHLQADMLINSGYTLEEDAKKGEPVSG